MRGVLIAAATAVVLLSGTVIYISSEDPQPRATSSPCGDIVQCAEQKRTERNRQRALDELRENLSEEELRRHGLD